MKRTKTFIGRFIARPFSKEGCISIFIINTFQPSSSARSADLLNAQTGINNDIQQNIHRGIVPNSSLPVLGLGGLSGLGDELAEEALPNELKQQMKKMSKKDATTKIKVRFYYFNARIYQSGESFPSLI